MKAYISISYSKRKVLDRELNAIKTTLLKLNFVTFIFVDNYNFAVSEERKMMKQAISDIDRCDILIAETSDKAIGVGIEVGYAKAKMKPIIYLRHKNADHSTTVSGISDLQIIYEDIPDLQRQLEEILTKSIKPGENRKFYLDK
ncbi:MAG TPA: nucleoside 2-deoxyribosyltransferase [Chitinophagaceae bacterium]|nr:nucleoside 2-deoxyribosyltransferase [Chitinophagaceae bacterium]